MSMRGVLISALVAAAVAPLGTTAQSYPVKPVRIVTAGAGGSSDLSSRQIAQGIAPALGQAVIVENRPGVIAVETAAKAAADGYTVLYYGSVIWNEPLIRANAPWDPIRDFAPVTMAVAAPNILTVHPSLPVKSVKELLALAKSRPGQLNYGSVGVGSSTHLAAELFKYMAKLNIERINYKATVGMFSDLISGELQLIFASPIGVSEYIKSGRLRALAVTSAQPSPLAPGLPTVAASGVPGYQAGTMEGMLAPAKTPEAIVARLNQEVVRYLRQPDVKERYFRSGAEVVGSTPEAMAATMRSEIERLSPMIKTAGIRAD